MSATSTAAPQLDLRALGYADIHTAAATLGVHHMTVWHLIHDGRMPGWEKHFGIWVIPLHMLEQFASMYDPPNRKWQP